ncbi:MULTISPECIES: hypothetical protein [unclassified Flagellimonas]|uniref:BZIP transcription factor n=1 Tax=Flagellimonas sp. MMG031 TaxID=3158549 RepID=A0AAU7MTX2_9FLAO
MYKLTLLFFVFCLSCFNIFGQNSFPASGSVGIGTLNPNPNFALDVNGALTASEILVGQLNVNELLVNGLQIESSPWNLNGNNVFYTGGNVGIGTNSPNFELDVAGTLNATNILINGTPLENSSSPWTLSGNNISYSAGNIGVGTSSPGYLLDVNGAFNASNIFINGTEIGPSPWSISGNDLSYSNGNVGIGTNSPNFELDVAGTLNATNILINGTPLENSSSPWTLSGNNISYSAGNIGVGTSSPEYLLDVNGSFNASNIFIDGTEIGPSPWSISGNDLFYSNGNIGIGTVNTQGYMLAVGGSMVAESIKVELQGNWPDFVFKKEFSLVSLKEVEAYIQKNHHLPNVPSAKEVKTKGINLGEMDATLLRKIEELTLYSIKQQKEIDSLKQMLGKKLKAENSIIESLEKRLVKLEKSSY